MSDVQDLLGMSSMPSTTSSKPSSQSSSRPLTPKPPPSKRFKLEPAKKSENMQRELYSLLGENTPPVAIIENKFRSKPNWRKKVTPWSWTGFMNPARSDDLLLYHWTQGSDEIDKDYSFAKYNVTVNVANIKREDYNLVLKAPSWTFEETQYLFDLCRKFELRWLVIHDRYDYEPVLSDGDSLLPNGEVDVDMNENEGEERSHEPEESRSGGKDIKKEESLEDHIPEDKSEEKSGDKPDDKIQSAEDSHAKSSEDLNSTESHASRTIEDLKERYYSVSRKLLQLRKSRGESLSSAEEELYKQMKYSKESEQKRKVHLEKLLARSPAELAEEEALVIESRKLEAAAERMLIERKELLKLLDAPQASGSITPYQTSQGLAQLTSTLLTTEKTKKVRKEAPPSGGNSGTGNTPTKQQPSSSASSSVKVEKSERVSGDKTVVAPKEAHTKDIKQESIKKAVNSGSAAVQAAIQRKLSAKEEAAFGISYHDKLQAGVYVRSSKITTFKPSAQAKITAALSELGLPARPAMPTAKVCAKFESLQHSIGVLMDYKKQVDKLETEIRIVRLQKGLAEPEVRETAEEVPEKKSENSEADASEVSAKMKTEEPADISMEDA